MNAPAFLRHTVRRPAGQFSSFDPDGGLHEADSLQCVHCQFIWEMQPGSGLKRGWCWRCGGPTCGKSACARECVPFEKAIEAMEARSRLLKAADRARQF